MIRPPEQRRPAPTVNDGQTVALILRDKRLPSAINALVRKHAYGPNRRDRPMPSLIRFLFAIALLAGLVYAGLWALANLVEPQPREMTETIPHDRIAK